MSNYSGMNHAIVIGGSIAGLLTARVLSNHFERVTIVERDPVARDHPEARKGQPQVRHLHLLLATGYRVMQRYFPDLPQALIDNGAIVADLGESMHWYIMGGYRKNFTMGVPIHGVEPPLARTSHSRARASAAQRPPARRPQRAAAADVS